MEQTQQANTAKKDKKPKQPGLLTRLKPYMGKKKILMPIAMLMSALSAIFQILPWVFIWLIAKEVISAPGAINTENLTYYAWLTFGSILLALTFYFVALMASHFAAFALEVNMRREAMAKIIKMPLGFFDKFASGKLRKTIDDNAGQTHVYVAHQLPDLAGSFVAPIIVLGLMFFFDWRLGLITLIPIVLGMFLMSMMMTQEGEKFRKFYMDQLEVMSDEAVEYVRAIPVVKTFGQSVYSFKRFVESITKYRDFVYTYTIMWKRPMSLYQATTQAGVLFLVPAAILFMTGENIAQVATDFVFYMLIAPLFTVLFMRIAFMTNYKMLATQVMDRFDEVLSYPPMEFVQDSAPIKDSSLEFKNVSFAYHGSETLALENINFKLEAGKTLALVGASGGGKTTIARLATRFWDAQQGEILVGGANIKELSKEDLMSQISFVFQNTQLFKKTLRENIIFGKQGVSDADIDTALEMSQAKAIIENLPNGLDTKIGDEQGLYLSGGEQQRIALARAIIKNAPIVLLDEATAFADPENEHLIQKALKNMSAGKTTLMIAHRLTSVVDADEILVLSKGKIAERGTHEALLNQGGIYKNMWDEYQQSIGWKL